MASNMPRQDIMYEIMERLGSHSVRGAHRDDCIMWTRAKAGLSLYQATGVLGIHYTHIFLHNLPLSWFTD